MSTRFACFTGWSNTGKSGFIEAVTAILSARGIPSGAIKCVRHEGSFNLPGKDTTRFFEAGAQAALVSGTETLRMTRTPPDWDRAWAASQFPAARVVLIEGRTVEGAVSVLVGGAAEDASGRKQPLGDFDVVITGHAGLAGRARAAGLAVFGPGEPEPFVDRYLTGGNMEDRQVTVTTGGVEVPINAFIKETIENVVLSMLKPLKKTNLEGEIVITIGAAAN